MSINLNVQKRNKGDKIEGMMPAVMYGHNVESTSIFVNKIAFKKILREAGESNIVSLSGDSTENVLIHDVQMDAISYEPVHADLYIVKKGQKVHIDIPLHFVNEAPATKLGGNVVKVTQVLSVEMDPTLAPSSIDVDLSKLTDLNSNISVKDISLPKGAILYHIHNDDIIASVVAQSDEDLSADVSKVDMENIGSSVEKGKKEEASE